MGIGSEFWWPDALPDAILGTGNNFRASWNFATVHNYIYTKIYLYFTFSEWCAISVIASTSSSPNMLLSPAPTMNLRLKRDLKFFNSSTSWHRTVLILQHSENKSGRRIANARSEKSFTRFSYEKSKFVNSVVEASVGLKWGLEFEVNMKSWNSGWHNICRPLNVIIRYSEIWKQ